GGFGGAPKFPPSALLEGLLRSWERTGDPAVHAVVVRTADAMARGGIYDQLRGGFARYSVDAAWVIPHFEKMLYDNAQ
ncbi:thioredoxin domain-containing protein, partial [Escherichia coli]